ncbi:MAG: preprotein translocase subunit SecA [Chloroflexi bacterium]|nr:preprotein translocase subunit SecA [Chloroflexota bacterium]
MFKNLVKMVLGDPVEKALAKYRETVAEINALEPQMQALSDAALRAKTDEFKQRLAGGATLDELLVEAFAVVREASVRSIQKRHFDVQLIGGIVLHQGRIAEMKTGEGKTLVATLPLYLNALSGKGVHLVTPNDYLSKFGLQQMGPIYHFLGLSSAVIQNMGNDPAMASFIYDPEYPSNDARYQFLRPVARREAYLADITYGTNNEYGFDYLRDNMVSDASQMVQRTLNYAIVDEVDNILIDEARTPLIISGPSDPPSPLYRTFTEIVRTLKPSSAQSIDDKDPDGDFVVDIKDRLSYLTEAGVEKVQRMLRVDDLYDPANGDMIAYLDNCLRAFTLYQRDKEYVVHPGKDGPEIVIVDEFTGRLMIGRRFSEGLHQAIEAKEGVPIRRENLTLATITFQNFFRMYKKLAGMTGTASTEAEEFEKIYNLEVVAIPTHRPVSRIDHEDLIYQNEKAKFEAVVAEIKERHQNRQPVLVGTVAIETSERLSSLLKRQGIKHEVLNAKNHEREAGIIAQAGQSGAVTIATNMAGRGVDILLGGNPEGIAREYLRQAGIDLTQATKEQWDEALARANKECAKDHNVVVEAGGLFVLGTERHEARRIDNQLRGRSGRQGDPGESRFYLSLEDDLMRRFGGDRMKNIMSWANLPENEPLEHTMVSRSIQQAQVRVEGHNFDIRKRVLEYDDVVNKQREVIYRQRRELLEQDSLREQYLELLEEMIAGTIKEFTPEQGEWDTEGLYHRLRTIFPVPPEFTPETLEDMTVEEMESQLIAALHTAYDAKTAELGAEIMKQAERAIMLHAIDSHWQRHLTDLDVLREGIGLVSVAQRDPLVEYKREAFRMWEALQDEIQTAAARRIFTVTVRQPLPQPGRRQMQAMRPSSNGGNAAPARPEPRRVQQRPGRNDPCWCGSGKKYKNCHMREDMKAKG